MRDQQSLARLVILQMASRRALREVPLPVVIVHECGARYGIVPGFQDTETHCKVENVRDRGKSVCSV